LTDLGEHRLKDLTEPERIFQLSEGPGGFPPLRSLQFYPNNLPVQLTTFIGRDDQLGEISALIGEHRLLTLTGVGGSGKTRLALQVAGAVIEQFPDGVWFIELGPVSDPGLVPAAVVDGLGISVRGSTPAIDALEDFLSDRRLLLVIDNCEHVLDAAAALAESLLKAAPRPARCGCSNCDHVTDSSSAVTAACSGQHPTSPQSPQASTAIFPSLEK